MDNMKKELLNSDKELLLKDLCARLPYGVKVQTTYIMQSGERKDIGIDILTTVEISMLIEGAEEHKPYLFPLSSMGDGQKVEYREEVMKYLGRSAAFFKAREQGKNITDKYIVGYEEIDWLNKNHFDYRGLIEKGLALDATGLNIY